MKIYNVEIKDSVRIRINEISDYIFRFSFSKESTKKIYDNIYKDIFSLKIFPNRFPKFDEKYRVLTIDKKYRVFFIVDEKSLNIIVSRIFLSYENYIERL